MHRPAAQRIPQLGREDRQRTPFLGLESRSHSDGRELPAQKERVSSGDGAGDGLLRSWETAKTCFEPAAWKLYKCRPVALQIFG